MAFSSIVLWVLLISLTTVFGSLYARKFRRADGLIALYVGIVLLSNVIATKIASYDLGFSTFFAPAAALIFPVTFLLTDIVNEQFGRGETQRMILLAFITQVAATLFTYLAIKLPVAPFWGGSGSFETVLSQVPRITAASWIAFLVSENLDAYIFSWFKGITKGRHLWARNVFSSLPAMMIDSVLFATIAFLGTAPIWPLILGVTITKWLVGLIDIPFMYLNRRIMQG